MAMEAIVFLKERTGSSRQAIVKHIQANNPGLAYQSVRFQFLSNKINLLTFPNTINNH